MAYGGLGVKWSAYGDLTALRLAAGRLAKVFICRLCFSRFVIGVAVFHLRGRGCPVLAGNYEGGWPDLARLAGPTFIEGLVFARQTPCDGSMLPQDRGWFLRPELGEALVTGFDGLQTARDWSWTALRSNGWFWTRNCGLLASGGLRMLWLESNVAVFPPRERVP